MYLKLIVNLKKYLKYTIFILIFVQIKLKTLFKQKFYYITKNNNKIKNNFNTSIIHINLLKYKFEIIALI